MAFVQNVKYKTIVLNVFARVITLAIHLLNAKRKNSYVMDFVHVTIVDTASQTVNQTLTALVEKNASTADVDLNVHQETNVPRDNYASKAFVCQDVTLIETVVTKCDVLQNYVQTPVKKNPAEKMHIV